MLDEKPVAKDKKAFDRFKYEWNMLMINREMVYSAKLGKMCTALKLHQLLPISQYYMMHPEKKRRKNDKREYIKETIESSFKEIDILLKLAGIYKSGDG